MDIILTQRDECILKCLVMCVRILSLRQMAVHWWNGEMANARRRMKQLAEVRLVAAIEVLARPISSLDGPVTCWWPGSPEPDFGALSYLFQNRLRRPPFKNGQGLCRVRSSGGSLWRTKQRRTVSPHTGWPRPGSGRNLADPGTNKLAKI